MKSLYFRVGLMCFLSLLIFSIFYYPSVSAFGPHTHFNITMSALAKSEHTLIKKIIEDNYDACLAGLAYPDVGIFEYFTNFKEYQSLHSYNTVNEMLRIARNDRDRAFAYCFKIHLAQDAISHNYFVPEAIRSTKLPNYIIHPIHELKIEGRYIDIVANRLMERHHEFDELVKKASGRDWSEEAEKLNIIMGGGEFYSKAYVPKSTSLFAKFQNSIYKLVSFFIHEKVGEDYILLAEKETLSVLRGETGTLDPSGEKALRSADAETQLWLYGLTFISIIVIFVLSFRFRIIGFSRRPIGW